MNKLTFVFFAVAMGCGIALPAHAQQRALTVAGRVVDRVSARPVANAAVELLDGTRTLTDSAGAFSFARVNAGATAIIVDAFGYADYVATLQLVRDTTLLILLDPAPVALDSLRAAARQVSVTGRVRDAVTGRVVVEGEVSGPSGNAVRMRINGSYRVRVPAGAPAAVTVRAFGYLPARAEVVAENDTTLDFRLEADPVMRQMLDAQRVMLDRRVREARYVLRAIDRDVIATLPALNLSDYLFGALLVPRNRVRCLYIDEMQFSDAYGFGALETYPIHMIQRIEIIDRGRMIRIYTTRFAQLLLTNPGPLPRVEMGNVHAQQAYTQCGSPRRW